LTLGDDPISTFEHDLFAWSGKAANLTALLYCISQLSGVCCGIVGDWGSGKSSFMKLIDDRVKAVYKDKTCSVWFTAWDPGSIQDLEDAMLYQFFKQLVEKKSPSVIEKDEKDKLDELFNKLKEALGLRRSLKQKLRIGLSAASKALPFSKQYMEAADELLKELDSNRKIKDVFLELTRWLIKNKITVFFFIDDIDRANPESIRDIIAELKVYISNPRIVTVIGYDYNYVVKSLEYPVLPKGVDPQKFLEKIVTINFPLPKPEVKNLFYFSEKLLSAFNEFHKEERGFYQTKFLMKSIIIS
jgi:predicted KAP-like P-loop ATPase